MNDKPKLTECFFCIRPDQKWPRDSLLYIKRQVDRGKFNVCETHQRKLDSSFPKEITPPAVITPNKGESNDQPIASE